MHFHGQYDMAVQARRGNINWPFGKGYTFALWIYIEQVKFSPEVGLSKLFTFHAEGSGGLEAYFIDSKLFYRVLGNSYTEPHVNSNGLFLCTI